MPLTIQRLSNLNLIFIFLLLLLSLFFSISLLFIIVVIILVGYIRVLKYPERYLDKYSSYLKNTLVIIFSIFISIIIIEVYLHLAQPDFLDFKESVLGDLSDYKSHGCDYIDEKTFIKPVDTFRILGLGDSFAVSDYPIQKNYHNFLSAAIKATGQKQVEIINAGMPSVGPGYYWHILEKYGDAWKPDLVLVGFYEGNDFEEMDFFISRGAFIREPSEPRARWLGYLKFQNLWFYRVIRGKLILMAEKYVKSKEKENARGNAVGSFSNMAFLHIERKRIWIFEKDKRADLDKLWQEKSTILLKFKEWCLQRKAPLVILIFPDQFQVDRNLREQIYQAYRLSPDNIDLEYPNRLLSEYCREHGIYCLDLLGPFQKEGAAQVLYKLRDTHWNEAGNRLAGELIFQYLAQHRLLPAP